MSKGNSLIQPTVSMYRPLSKDIERPSSWTTHDEMLSYGNYIIMLTAITDVRVAWGIELRCWTESMIDDLTSENQDWCCGMHSAHRVENERPWVSKVISLIPEILEGRRFLQSSLCTGMWLGTALSAFQPKHIHEPTRQARKNPVHLGWLLGTVTCTSLSCESFHANSSRLTHDSFTKSATGCTVVFTSFPVKLNKMPSEVTLRPLNSS